MKIKKFSEKPSDIETRIGAKPIVCYPNINIEEKNLSILHSAREQLVKKMRLSSLLEMQKHLRLNSVSFLELRAWKGHK